MQEYHEKPKPNHIYTLRRLLKESNGAKLNEKYATRKATMNITILGMSLNHCYHPKVAL